MPDNLDRELAARIQRAIDRARPRIESAVAEAIYRTKLSALSRAKLNARQRLTSRGAENYASFYRIDPSPNIIGLRNDHPPRDGFNVSMALETTGVRPHVISSSMLAGGGRATGTGYQPTRDLVFIWFSEHIPSSLSTGRGDDMIHRASAVWHVGISPLFMMRDALRSAYFEDMPRYLSGISRIIEEEVNKA